MSATCRHRSLHSCLRIRVAFRAGEGRWCAAKRWRAPDRACATRCRVCAVAHVHMECRYRRSAGLQGSALRHRADWRCPSRCGVARAPKCLWVAHVTILAAYLTRVADRNAVASTRVDSVHATHIRAHGRACRRNSTWLSGGIDVVSRAYKLGPHIASSDVSSSTAGRHCARLASIESTTRAHICVRQGAERCARCRLKACRRLRGVLQPQLLDLQICSTARVVRATKHSRLPR